MSEIINYTEYEAVKEMIEELRGENPEIGTEKHALLIEFATDVDEYEWENPDVVEYDPGELFDKFNW